MPCPLASPGFWSPTNVYRGIPLNVTCVIPPGRLTAASEPTLPLGELPAVAMSGGHAFRHPPLVQIHFPACSPERLYSVMPLESTRTVLPTVPLDAVFTTEAEVPPPAVTAAGLVVALELLDVLLELLPHAASSTDAASVGTTNLVI